MQNDQTISIPTGYFSLLSLQDTIRARALFLDAVRQHCRDKLGRWEVTPPTEVEPASGLGEWRCMQSSSPTEPLLDSTKWNRTALLRYGLRPGQGIFHLRHRKALPEEPLFAKTGVMELSMETLLLPGERNRNTLETLVRQFHQLFLSIEKKLSLSYPPLPSRWPDDVLMITTQHLENLFPSLSYDERLVDVVSQELTVFLEQPAKLLNNGKQQQKMPPDRDDWEKSGIWLAWEPIGKRVLCLGKSGIRVDVATFCRQANLHQKTYCASEFQRLLLAEQIPDSVGISVNLSAVLMLLLKKLHPGEVSCGIWPDIEYSECQKRGIHLL